jgi:hypothetical protein
MMGKPSYLIGLCLAAFLHGSGVDAPTALGSAALTVLAWRLLVIALNRTSSES